MFDSRLVFSMYPGISNDLNLYYEIQLRIILQLVFFIQLVKLTYQLAASLDQRANYKLSWSTRNFHVATWNF